MTVSKFLGCPVPPGWQRSKLVHSPKIGECTGIINAIFADDKLSPEEYRHSDKYILQRLRGEQGFYVREQTGVSTFFGLAGVTPELVWLG